MSMKLANSRLQFITHYTEKYSYIDSARIALEGGCRWIQLRMKEAEESVLEETALIVQKMCRDYGATFIIDDCVPLVKKIKADGVHLGKNDMPIAEARRLLGDSFIIGGTVNSLEDVRATYNRPLPIISVVVPSVSHRPRRIWLLSSAMKVTGTSFVEWKRPVSTFRW